MTAALEAVLRPAAPAWALFGAAAVSLGAAWILYVPAHELLHAAGCAATGCEVTELRLAPLYGARMLARLFPFVVVDDAGGPYAGRLSGFDTGGSDARLLAIDLAPYLLTVLIGVPLLRAVAAPPPAGASGSGWRVWAFGPAVVLATAPFLSVTGDYYEIGSTLVTRWLPDAYREIRSDDLFETIGRLRATPAGTPRRGLFVTLSAAVGLVLAGWTYALGGGWSLTARRLGPASAAPRAPDR